MDQFLLEEGNEELLEEIYPIIRKSYEKEADNKIKELKEKARWGSMRICLVKSQSQEIIGMGLATVNNLNTGHGEYIIVRKEHANDSIDKLLLERLELWLKWLKVKSITIECEATIW